MTSSRRAIAVLFTALGVWTMTSGGRAAQNPLQVPVPAPQVFRGGTSLVPVDVRVIDRKVK